MKKLVGKVEVSFYDDSSIETKNMMPEGNNIEEKKKANDEAEVEAERHMRDTTLTVDDIKSIWMGKMRVTDVCMLIALKYMYTHYRNCSTQLDLSEAFEKSVLVAVQNAQVNVGEASIVRSFINIIDAERYPNPRMEIARLMMCAVQNTDDTIELYLLRAAKRKIVIEAFFNDMSIPLLLGARYDVVDV